MNEQEEKNLETVGELIDLLQKFPRDAIVRIGVDDGFESILAVVESQWSRNGKEDASQGWFATILPGGYEGNGVWRHVILPAE